MCSVDGCERTTRARGYCSTHYAAARRNGTLQKAQSRTTEQLFLEKVDRAGDCWLWLAAKQRNGYGVFAYGGRSNPKTVRAHRFAFELFVRPLADGEHVDHTCFTRACVNPDHLRAVTQAQNNQNLRGARKHSKSGVRGVYWHKAAEKWAACVTHNRRSHHLGLFANLDDAAAAARKARLELFTHNDVDRAA